MVSPGCSGLEGSYCEWFLPTVGWELSLVAWHLALGGEGLWVARFLQEMLAREKEGAGP